MLLRPDGAPAVKRKIRLTRQDVKVVLEFERWCQAMGLQLDLLCPRCLDNGTNPRAWGNNRPDATSYTISCNCTDRSYGDTSLGVSNTQKTSSVHTAPKIQVVVP